MINDWPGLSSNVTSICFTAESLVKKKHTNHETSEDLKRSADLGIPRNENT